jgi:cyclophilin family peptidyl-prolyl cis-trans isomerase
MTRRPALALLLAAALVGAGCGDDDEPAIEAVTTAEQETETGCQSAQAPAARPEPDLDKPKLRLSASKEWTATVKTNCGSFTIALDARRAPKTGGSFVTLARSGFYDGLGFHRIVSGFVIQGGDPKGDGSGGPGYSVVEAPPKSLKYTRGVVAMAKTEVEKPGTSGSQFFVVTAEDAQLPPEYALVGKVTQGQDVVDRIGASQTDAQDKPTDPVVMQSVTVKSE